MIDEKKKIEELSKDLQKLYEKYGLFDFEWFAEDLQKLGYSKISKNALVLTREEYDRLLGQYKNLEINYNCVWEDFRRYEIENEILKQNIVVLRKETAREICGMLDVLDASYKQKGLALSELKEWIKNNYDLEVK